MKLLWMSVIVLVLGGEIIIGQTGTAPTQRSAGAANPVADYMSNLPKLSVAKDEVVVTVEVCDPPTTGKCQTRLTREQFEAKFRTAYEGPRRPNEHFPNATARADQLVKLLAYSDEARREGLDKEPEFQEELKSVEEQLLVNALQRKLKGEAVNPSDKDLQNYYDKISKKYQELTVRSVFIPRPPRSNATTKTTELSEGAAPWPEGEDVETQKIGDEARRQLAAGEDPDKVEQAAFAAVKSTKKPPSTQAQVWRRNGSFPAGEETMLFGMRVGEVSPPVPNGSGLTIYKVESKRTIPLEEVKGEVQALYQMDKVQGELNSFLERAHPVLNRQYFDTEKEAELRAREMDKQKEEAREKAVQNDQKPQ